MTAMALLRHKDFTGLALSKMKFQACLCGFYRLGLEIATMNNGDYQAMSNQLICNPSLTVLTQRGRAGDGYGFVSPGLEQILSDPTHC